MESVKMFDGRSAFKAFALAFGIAFASLPVFAKSTVTYRNSPEEVSARSVADSFVQGLSSYKNGQWKDAQLFLRQAVSDPRYSNDSNWYMIIMSQIYLEEYADAINDCSMFMENYPDSPLLSAVEYQKGRAYHCIGQNDNSVMALSGFCNQYPDSNMYSSALFWIAECFYDEFDYDTSRALYERIVADFPESAKRGDAEFKLSLIAQHDREQKLLFLLKMTGEEYLNSRENYEKQLRMSQNDDSKELRRQLNSANARVRELEGARPAAYEKTAVFEGTEVTVSNSAEESSGAGEKRVLSLKSKAAMIQKLLDDNGEGE
ncbi:MAG: tetratricopeptide repeat protein [Treponema sp.]|nr:tetratricopeptide repeat protein [Treponema sp.]